MKTIHHPILPWSITFDPATHTYRDHESRTYESVTAFISHHFEPFNESKALAEACHATGRIELDIAAEWREKGRLASACGTTVHIYAESLINGTTPPAPATDQERRAFGIVDRALTALSASYEIISAEQIIFDPLYMLAGTIDVATRNRETGALAILDWKTNESITSDSYGKRALSPISNVPDSKVSHYALQLSTYAWLLTAKGWSSYPTEGEPVELAIIHIPHVGNDPVWRPLPYMAEEVEAMVYTNTRAMHRAEYASAKEARA